MPAREFVEPACGNRGGPRGAPLANFGEFRKCPAEPGGLREIWFEYDDTIEYVALARRDPPPGKTTSVLDQPVVLSLLIDEAGFARGYRVVTDTRAEHDLRLHAHEAALHFRARFGLDGHCEDLPAAPGETAVDGEFVKQDCAREADGRRVVSRERFHYRPGQQFRDPHTNQPMVNAFESSARLEVLWTTPPPATPPAARLEPAFAGQREAFLAGAARDCPGCDLARADLRYRDLDNASLAGANLRGASLHRASLRGADLAGVDLAGANLNRATLASARLAGATLAGAMLWQADATRADFTGVDLSRGLMGKAILAFARLDGARLDGADLGEARLNDASLARASLAGADLALATLFRARLAGVAAAGARFLEARLREADFSEASLRDTDFSRADLNGANLRGADFSGARMFAADLGGAAIEGANFAGVTGR